MIPGPVEVDAAVLQACATPATSHVAPSFVACFGETLEALRAVLMSSAGQPFVLAGSGTLGWDLAAANLVEPGESVLVVNTGYFGDRFGECLEAYGATIVHVRAPTIGSVPSLDVIRAALLAQTATGSPFKLVTITHVDTSTGVLNAPEPISRLVREHSPSSLVCVDGVCSVGAENLRMDAWDIDIVITASQKALGAPPGLCVFVASQRAMAVYHARKAPVQTYFASFKKWLPIMLAYESRKPSYFATPAVQLIMGLRVSLSQLLADGMDSRFEKHVVASRRVKAALLSWGLHLVPTDTTHAANSLTAVYYPPSISPPDFLKKVAENGVIVAGGLHPEIAAKYFRIGHVRVSSLLSPALALTPLVLTLSLAPLDEHLGHARQ